MLNVLQKHLQCKGTGPPDNSVSLSSPYLVHWAPLLSYVLVLSVLLVHTVHSYHEQQCPDASKFQKRHLSLFPAAPVESHRLRKLEMREDNMAHSSEHRGNSNKVTTWMRDAAER